MGYSGADVASFLGIQTFTVNKLAVSDELSEIEKYLSDQDLEDGEHELIEVFSEFKYPIKIVVSVENDIITVITNYPLKKGIKK